MKIKTFITVLLLVCVAPRESLSEVYDLPVDGSDVVGALTVIQARADDTLIDIARRHGLGYEDMVIANPDVDVWLPGEGTEVILPTRYVLPTGPRKGVVLNLAEYRMYYYPPAKTGERPVVMTFPISIGRMDWETPLGMTRVVSKVRKPAWYPPASVRAEHEADGRPLARIVPPGPDNPLGDFAMRLGLPGYLIHGTNRPAGVGMRVTHGCIRMFPEDIEYLFEQLGIETPVRIINEPLKVGWDGDELVLEVHRTLSSSPPDDIALQNIANALTAENAAAITDVDDNESLAAEDVHTVNGLTALTAQFVAATQTRQGAIDWEMAERQLIRPSGIPLAIGRSIKNAATSAAFESSD
ncbi:MAG: L,D-transpeptidase family protein [Gammaproteobacteria bacterium]|nr:L,D-transpeptidase family protein [Gammaproteobacteria bacterium]